MEKKSAILQWAPLTAIIGLFITIMVLYSNAQADIRANTEYRQYTETYFNAKLEVINYRLQQIESKLDRILQEDNKTKEAGAK